MRDTRRLGMRRGSVVCAKDNNYRCQTFCRCRVPIGSANVESKQSYISDPYNTTKKVRSYLFYYLRNYVNKAIQRSLDAHRLLVKITPDN